MTYHDDYDVALSGGTWRLDPKTRVLRWVQLREPDIRPANLKPIACHACGAREDQACRSRNGERTKDHPARATPRTCPCGAPPKPRSTHCAKCRRKGQMARLVEESWAA
ncbi:MAG: hypothetical protein ACXVXW_04905 [Mycobacteriaceae bacterium]